MVEDDDANRKIMGELLDRSGSSVYLANNGQSRDLNIIYLEYVIGEKDQIFHSHSDRSSNAYNVRTKSNYVHQKIREGNAFGRNPNYCHFW